MLKAGLSGYQIWYHAIAFAEGLRESKTIKIVSVFDEDPRQAQRLGEASGGAKVFTDLDKFIDSGIDIAILTGLPSKKLNEIKKLASTKKHILVDKPISSTSEDAFEIVQVCRKENIKLMVGYNLQWAKALRKAKEILQDGKLGKPFYGFYAYDGPMLQETEWSKKPGWRMDKKENMSCWFTHADHGINTFMWLLDSIYTDVFAQIKNLANPQYDSSDWGIGIFTMENGTKIVLKCDATTPPEFEILNIRIICENGGLVFNYFPQSSLEVIGPELTGNKICQYSFDDHWQKALPKMAEEFASCVMDNNPIPKYLSGEIAGYRLLKTAEIAHQSNALNKQLKISFDM